MGIAYRFDKHPRFCFRTRSVPRCFRPSRNDGPVDLSGSIDAPDLRSESAVLQQIGELMGVAVDHRLLVREFVRAEACTVDCLESTLGCLARKIVRPIEHSRLQKDLRFRDTD